MNRTFARVFSLVALVALVASMMPFSAPVTAQDDDAALLQRVATAAEATNSYESYVRTDLSETALALTMDLMGFAFEQSQANTSAFESIVILGDNPNFQTVGTVSATLIGTDTNTFMPTTTSSDIAAEVRLVDNILYFNGEVLSSEGADLPTVPAGWVIVSEDVSGEIATGVLDGTLGLNIAGFDLTMLGSELFATDEPNEGVNIDNILELLELANDVTLTQETMDDGSAVDVVTVTFDALEVFQSPLLGNTLGSADPTTAALVGSMLNDSIFEMNFAIDDQERLVGLFFAVDFALQTDDLSSVIDTTEMGLPEGMSITLDMVATFEMSQIYTDINAIDTPVEAPADAVVWP